MVGTGRLTERYRVYCANPPTHLRLVLFTHVEETGRHRGMNRRPRPIIGCHIHDTSEHFQEACIPIFGNVMERGEPGIDECLKVAANRFATLPIRYAEIANHILREAVKQSKPFPKVLSSVSLHMSRSHVGGSFFVRVTCMSLSWILLMFMSVLR
jgi:hypothetical protein